MSGGDASGDETDLIQEQDLLCIQAFIIQKH